MRVLIAVALAIALVGCGEKSDEDQIRDQAVDYVQALQSGDLAGACERTTDPKDCIATFRAAELLLGGRDELIVAAGINDEAVERARNAPISAEGDRATIEGTRGKSMQARHVDGEWKLVLPKLPSD